MRIILWCSLLIASFYGAASAAADTPHLADLHREVWTSKEGAPADIFSMAQTSDGWLWLSTNNGLYRFDGIRFERFQPRPGEALQSARLTNLYAAPNGDLWLGYGGGGISVLHNGYLTHHAPAHLDIGSLYGAQQDPDGSLWLADGGGLLHFANGAWRRLGAADGWPAGVTAELFIDQDGRIWVTVGGRVFVRRHPGGRFERVHPGEGNGGFAAAPDGRVWLETGKGMTVLDAPDARAGTAARAGHRPTSSAQYLFDRAGNLWTLKSGTTFCFIPAAALAGKKDFLFDAMPHETLGNAQQARVRPHAFLEDREGNVWVANSKGLERFRSQRVHLLPMDKKYGTFALANDGPQALWVVAKPAGDLWHVAGDTLAQVPGKFNYFMARTVSDGAVLFSGMRGVERRAQGQFEATPVRDAQARLAPALDARNGDFDGASYWAQDTARGVVKLTPAGWRSAAELGYPAGRSLIRTNAHGQVWLLYDDKVIETQTTPARVYTAADGIDVGKMNSLELEHDVTVLGDTGIAVRIGARFHRVNVDRPDLLANALALTASANGDRWINANGGLVRILAADWQAWLAQPQRILATTLFDGSDGYPGAQGSQRSGMATTDHGKRVWFVGKDGPAWIDSTTIVRNRLAPAVEVVRLHAGAQAYFSDDRPRLAAGTKHLDIDYAALSYSMPERIRFQYRLVGLDDAWQDGGARRSVEYTNLAPGAYRFEVRAANEDGVWGALPATMHFSIAPLFTQTWWFFALSALLVLGVLSLLYQARVRSVRKHIADRLHERLHERERIARSLHDTYLQSVQGLIYVFHGLAQNLPAPGDAQDALDRALALADDVLLQGREQVMGLRTSARGAGTLAQSLGEICQALAVHDATTCSVVTSGAERPLRAHVMEELFYIGREALINAVRHAHGTVVVLTLHYGASKFVLCIQDDGIGLPADMLAHGERDGHWGLPGMRERARHLHATLAVSNTPGSGARIMLTVPGRMAYIAHETARQALARWWRRRAQR